MISTRWTPRNRRLLVAAFAFSIAVHLIGGALWADAVRVLARVMHRAPDQSMQEQQVATSDTIRLEKRTVPRPAQRSEAQHPVAAHAPAPRAAAPRAAAPQPEAVPAPSVKRPSPKHELPVPDGRPEIAHRAPHAPSEQRKPDVAHAPGSGAAPAKHAARKAALSAAEIAQLNAQFAKTIASSRTDLATIQKRTEEQPSTIRRYPMQFTGAQAQLQRGEGYISPITVGQRVGGSVSYYTHYTYMWPDGHIEDDDIPWPFHFPVNRDLFALHVHLIPLQPPPPGFHFSRPLKPFLAHFVQRAQTG